MIPICTKETLESCLRNLFYFTFILYFCILYLISISARLRLYLNFILLDLLSSIMPGSVAMTTESCCWTHTGSRKHCCIGNCLINMSYLWAHWKILSDFLKGIVLYCWILMGPHTREITLSRYVFHFWTFLSSIKRGVNLLSTGIHIHNRFLQFLQEQQALLFPVCFPVHKTYCVLAS